MKTINTKENQVTLHTKDTIIEEDIQVVFEGGGSDLLSYAKQILGNDTEDYPAKAIFIMPEKWSDSISSAGIALKFSDEPENIYTVNGNYFKSWDNSKCETYKENYRTIKIKWFITYYENTIFKYESRLMRQALAVYVKDAEYINPNSSRVIDSSGSSIANCVPLEFFGSNTALKLTKELSLGPGQYECVHLKNLPEFDTSEFGFSNFTTDGCVKLTKIKARNNVLKTKKIKVLNNYSLCEIPEIDLENGDFENYVFSSCVKLKEIRLRNAGSVKTFNQSFYNCHNLETLTGLNLINAKSSLTSYFFDNCRSLKNLEITNIKVSLKIANGTQWGHLLTVDSLINTCKELIKTGSALTLTMGTTNLNKLADVYVKFTDPSITEIAEGEKGDVVVCESTDEGAMLITTYTTMKGWTLA